MSTAKSWRSNRKQVFAGQVFPCVYCGCTCAWHSLKSGRPVPVEVDLDEKTRKMTIVTGQGNNKNFVPIHDCRAAAAALIPNVERELEALERSHAIVLDTVSKAFRVELKSKNWNVYPEGQLRYWMRKTMADNIRRARKIVKTAPAEIQAKRDLLNYLLERATSTAVYQ